MTRILHSTVAALCLMSVVNGAPPAPPNDLNATDTQLRNQAVAAYNSANTKSQNAMMEIQNAQTSWAELQSITQSAQTAGFPGPYPPDYTALLNALSTSFNASLGIMATGDNYVGAGDGMPSGSTSRQSWYVNAKLKYNAAKAAFVQDAANGFSLYQIINSDYVSFVDAYSTWSMQQQQQQP